MPPAACQRRWDAGWGCIFNAGALGICMCERHYESHKIRQAGEGVMGDGVALNSISHPVQTEILDRLRTVRAQTVIEGDVFVREVVDAAIAEITCLRSLAGAVSPGPDAAEVLKPLRHKALSDAPHD